MIYHICRFAPMQNKPFSETNAEQDPKSPPIPPPPPRVLPFQCGPVQYPNVNDVLSGRGGRINAHPGNLRFRQFVNHFKETYIDEETKKVEKAYICTQIVHLVRAQHPPGRFLKRDDKHGYWFEIGDVKARKKTGQALREDAPGVRQQGSHDGASTTSETKTDQNLSSFAAEKERGAVNSSCDSSSDEVSAAPVPSSTMSTQAFVSPDPASSSGIATGDTPVEHDQSAMSSQNLHYFRSTRRGFHAHGHFRTQIPEAPHEMGLHRDWGYPMPQFSGPPPGHIHRTNFMTEQNTFGGNIPNLYSIAVGTDEQRGGGALGNILHRQQTSFANVRRAVGNSVFPASSLVGQNIRVAHDEALFTTGHELDDLSTSETSFKIEDTDLLSVGNLSCYSWGTSNADNTGESGSVPPKEIALVNLLPLPLSKRSTTSRLA
jgi:hypothetical protein